MNHWQRKLIKRLGNRVSNIMSYRDGTVTFLYKPAYSDGTVCVTIDNLAQVQEYEQQL